MEIDHKSESFFINLTLSIELAYKDMNRQSFGYHPYLEMQISHEDNPDEDCTHSSV